MTSSTEAALVMALARDYWVQDRHDKALSLFWRATCLAPDVDAYRRELEQARSHLLARRFPGPDYLDVLRRLHTLLTPKVYLEIGVHSGASLKLARHSELAIGIDPAPVADEIPSNAILIRTASRDALTAGRELPGTAAFDFAFIDGSHLYEDALFDFCAIERFAHARSVVAIHDVLPLDGPTSQRETQEGFWTGDVWKVISHLRRCRTDLRISIVPTRPSGLALVSGFASDSRASADLIEPLAELLPLDFLDHRRSFAADFVCVENSEAGLRQALDGLIAVA